MQTMIDFLYTIFQSPLPGTDKDLSISDFLTKFVFTVFLTYFLIYFVQYLIHQFFKKAHFIEEKRKQTIEVVIKNSSTYIAFTIIALTIITPFIDLKNLLVAGGVLGIVLGFGAQNLIKDFLYGFFFLFESQFKKGDFVHLNGDLEGGVVEDLGFRALKVRLTSGKLLTISNGEIKQVVNGNVEQRRIFESLIVSFRENPTRINTLLSDLVQELNETHSEALKIDADGNLLEPFQVWGLSSIDSTPLGYKFTLSATVLDTDYLPTAQHVKERIAQMIFDHKITMPEQNVFFKTRTS